MSIDEIIDQNDYLRGVISKKNFYLSKKLSAFLISYDVSVSELSTYTSLTESTLKSALAGSDDFSKEDYDKLYRTIISLSSFKKSIYDNSLKNGVGVTPSALINLNSKYFRNFVSTSHHSVIGFKGLVKDNLKKDSGTSNENNSFMNEENEGITLKDIFSMEFSQVQKSELLSV